MREQDIQNLIASQRPYYHLQGTPIRGIDNQYWLVFKHQDADSLLKFYEDPLQEFLQSDGRIQLLMDWRGFTKEKDIIALEQLYDTSNPTQFIQRTLQEFLAGLEESSFSGTEILAELIRLGFIEIKLVKMEGGRGIYHSKTGIFSDSKDNHEKQRRIQTQQPQIDSITPNILTPGLNTISIIGDNLDQVTNLEASNDCLVDITITSQTPRQIEADITIATDHPPPTH